MRVSYSKIIGVAGVTNGWVATGSTKVPSQVWGQFKIKKNGKVSWIAPTSTRVKIKLIKEANAGIREMALHEENKKLMKARTFEEILGITAKGLAKALKFERTFTYAFKNGKLFAEKQILRWDKNGKPVYEDRKKSAFLIGKALTEKDSKVWKEAIDEKKIQVIQDPSNDWRCDPEKVKRDGTGPFIVAPLVVGEETIGLFSINKGELGGAFNKQDIRLIETLVNQAALRMENIELVDELGQLLEKSLTKSRLNEQFAIAAAEISKGLNPKEKLQKAVQALVEHSRDIDGAAIRVFDEKTNELVVVASEGLGKNYISRAERVSLKDTTGISVKAFNNEYLTIVKELEGKETHRSLALKAGFHSQAVQPFVIEDKTAGVINIYSKERGAFDENDLRVPFAVFSAVVSAAIENARRFAQTLTDATIDGLTGALVRRYLMDRGRAIFEALRMRKMKNLSAIMIDIDDFKKINDTHGHQAGDKVLRALVDIIKWTIHGIDIVGRYGGEEFLIFLPNTDKKGARTVAEHIVRNIREMQEKFGIPKTKKSGLLGWLLRKFTRAKRVTITLGIATAPNDGRDMDEIIGKADKALYLGKRNGKDQFIAYGEKSSKKKNKK